MMSKTKQEAADEIAQSVSVNKDLIILEIHDFYRLVEAEEFALEVNIVPESLRKVT